DIRQDYHHIHCNLGRDDLISVTESLKRLVCGFHQQDLLIPGVFQNHLQHAPGRKRVINHENAHGSALLPRPLEPSSLPLSASAVKRRPHCCRHRSTIGAASSSTATTNTGQLHRGGSTGRTASAPPPSALMESAMKT